MQAVESTKSGFNRAALIILGILLLALVLRIWGVWFGLPFLFHNDEGFEVVRALQLGTGEFDFGRVSKGGYFYVLFVEYGMLFVTMLVSGVVHSANDFAELYLSNPTSFYLVGRITTAVIGTITVYLVYKTGRIAYTDRAGLIAAALLAVNVLHADLSHFITVDVPMTCLALASLYFAVKITRGEGGREYWWAALMAALATTTKMPAVLLVISLLIAHGYGIRAANGGIRAFFTSPRLWQAAAIFVVAYLVLTPGMVLYGDDVVRHVLAKFGIGTDTWNGFDSGGAEEDFELDDRAMYANTNLFVFYLRVLIDSMTYPVFALCMAGLGYALWRRRPADVVLGSFALSLYLVISSSSDIKQFFPRYLLPAFPVMVLFGGRMLDKLLSDLGGKRAAVSAGLLVAVIAAWPVAEIVAADRLIVRTDTRALGRHWADEHIAEGAKIFIEGHRTLMSKGTIPLQNSAENIRESIEYYRGSEPGRVKYFQTLLKAQTGKTYDLLGVSPRELQDLEYYKNIGVQYFVLRPGFYPGSRLHFRWVELLDAIQADPDVKLVQRFDPEKGGRLERPGPLIEIYRVTGSAATAGKEPG